MFNLDTVLWLTKYNERKVTIYNQDAYCFLFSWIFILNICIGFKLHRRKNDPFVNDATYGYLFLQVNWWKSTAICPHVCWRASTTG
jgi:hypothetical protein